MDNTLGLYNWASSDEITTSIAGVANNFKLIEKDMEQRSYNVKSPVFGAKGDFVLDSNGKPPANHSVNSTKDDHSAIQKAFNACRADGGGVVYFPAGVYAIKNPIRVYKNTKVVFHPQAVIVRNATIGYMFTNGDTGDAHTKYNGNGNIHFEGNGARLEGNKLNFVKKFNHISFAHAYNISFQDLRYEDCIHYHHMEINSSKKVVVRGCSFDGFMLDPNETDPDRQSEALQFDGAYDSSVFGAFGAYDNTTCDDVLVEGCSFTNTDRGVGSHTSKTNYHHKNIRIVGNHFYNIADIAIVTCMWDGTVIDRNTFDTVGAGVWIRTKDSTSVTSDYVVSNNTFRNVTVGSSARHAIRVSGLQVNTTAQIQNVTISGNTVFDCAQTVFYLQGMKKFSVSGNTITKSGGGGIYTLKSEEGVISANVLVDINGNSGISIQDGSWVNATGNLLNKIAQHGIWLDTSTNCLVGTNSVREASASQNGGYCHIYVSGGAGNAMVTGNTLRSGSPQYGIWVTSSQTNCVVVGNYASPLAVHATSTSNNTLANNY